MSKQLEEAVRICHQLQNWVEGHEGLSTIPAAHFMWTANNGVECISVGDIQVWTACGSSSDEFTFEDCLEQYKNELRSLMPLMDGIGLDDEESDCGDEYGEMPASGLSPTGDE